MMTRREKFSDVRKEMKNITKEELINEISERVKEIKELYKRANPNADYLTICLFKDSYSFHNAYSEEDSEYPIDEFVLEEDNV